MSKTLKNILLEYLAYRNGSPNDYVFCNTYGGKPDERTTQQSLADYNKSHGVLKTSAHLSEGQQS